MTDPLNMILGLHLVIAECESFGGPPNEQGPILRRAYDLLNPSPSRYDSFRFRALVNVGGFESAALLLAPPDRCVDIGINSVRPGHDGLWSIASFQCDDDTALNPMATAISRFPALAITAAILKWKCEELVNPASGSDNPPHAHTSEEASDAPA